MRSYSRSISATILFASAPTFDKSDCENATFEYTDLTQVRVMWTYKKGDKVIKEVIVFLKGVNTIGNYSKLLFA